LSSTGLGIIIQKGEAAMFRVSHKGEGIDDETEGEE
jgi:hypothetical protein